jgi:hypothetical protein
MHNLPLYIPIVFGITTLLTVGLFAKAAGNVKATLIIILLWLAIQSAISLTGFYAVTSSNPPRFLLAVLPPVLVIVVLFVSQAGRQYIDNFSISVLTILHTIRVPVELVLFWLFINKVIPQLMTFEGRNFDILSGLSAPIIFFWIYKETVEQYSCTPMELYLLTPANKYCGQCYPFRSISFSAVCIRPTQSCCLIFSLYFVAIPNIASYMIK